jgi:galactokinase
MPPREQVLEHFRRVYGERPSVLVRAPGRVNLIGEHTDYNDGFVLPMAIDRAAWIALRPRADRAIHIHALDYDAEGRFALDDLRKDKADWLEYIKGVAWALTKAGYILRGWEGVIAGDVPIGAGLSSSAALELATARAFCAVSDFAWDVPQMAKLCQKAENQWVGVNSGIMDQMISAAGKADNALLIDCRTLEIALTPLPPGTVAVVMDTGTRRGLVGSAYNERRSQCESAAQFYGVAALRDLTLSQFEERAAQLDERIRRRARHVISENERTLAARDAMNDDDAARLGLLMNASHDSLRDDFEVSSDALNVMVAMARAQAGCYGARMTGAGFGGCAVALVAASDAPVFVEQVEAAYRQQTPHHPGLYICHATDGAQMVTL